MKLLIWVGCCETIISEAFVVDVDLLYVEPLWEGGARFEERDVEDATATLTAEVAMRLTGIVKTGVVALNIQAFDDATLGHKPKGVVDGGARQRGIFDA